MAQVEVWHGDICELEVEAIVVPAVTSLWMATGVAAAVKRAGGERIEFEAIRRGPVPLGTAVVTGAGSLAARWVIHAVTLDRHRRTSAAVIAAAVRDTMGHVRRLGIRSLAIPALGSGVGGFPLEEGAQVTVATVRDELPRCPILETVVFALKGSGAYRVFAAALAAGGARWVPTGAARTGGGGGGGGTAIWCAEEVTSRRSGGPSSPPEVVGSRLR